MALLENLTEVNRSREVFLRRVFGNAEGYLCIAYGTKDKKHFVEEFFFFPKEIDKVNDLCNRLMQTHNVWFCPQLLSKRARRKENISQTPNAWSDLDSCEPAALLVKPTVTVESSPGRFQAYWRFEDEVLPDDAENLSQRIAYHHADEGADRSGWDLTQLLRMPNTYNWKYSSAPEIRILELNRTLYQLADFDEHYDKVKGYEYLDVDMPDQEDVLDEEQTMDLIQRNRLKMNPMIWQLWQTEPNEDWSHSAWRLILLLLEAGFTRSETYAIMRFSACNKYARDGRSEVLLWKEVCRGEAQHLSNEHSLSRAPVGQEPLLSDQERSMISSEDTFIERYINWAKSLGDAAVQYHQAGAFTALSAILAGNVRLPTSFGTVIPNLWFMILADTTLTRKSTAMDIAMDLVNEIDDEITLATDGSIEGLLTGLSMRPGRPGVFLRDEFSGLLEQMTKKDYMAGMPELLTKLYDGKLQKRMLRKEVIEVKEPILIFFAGGIKDKICSLLSFEHVSSGFMPRFVFITAESDITKVKPLGPPTGWTDDNRDAIRSELEAMAAHYKQTTIMRVENSKIQIEKQKHFPAQLSPEAWHRYNALEAHMMELGMSTQRPDIMTPVYDRLCKSILKAAVLLSASEQRGDTIEVTLQHILRAIGYGETWQRYANEVMNSVGKGQVERELDKIYQAVLRSPGVARSYLMSSYHLTAQDANRIFETLEQRALITRQKQGRGETLWPVNPQKKTAKLDFSEQEKAV